MATERTLVLYVIDEATDEVAATVHEAGRLSRQLHLWQGAPPSVFDADTDGLRTVGLGLRFTAPLSEADRPGVVRLLEYVVAAAESLGVCFEVQLDGKELGLVAPEGLQPWVADGLREELGLVAPLGPR